MSVKATSAVWEHSQTVGTARLVMLAIADSANDAGWQSYDKQETIASKVNVSPRTVERAVNSAIELGELEVHRPDRSGRNQYSVMLPGLEIFESEEARKDRDEWYEKMALGRAEKTRQNRVERQANRRSEDPTPPSGPRAEGPDTSVGSDPTPVSGGDPTAVSGLKGNQQLKPLKTKDRNVARATEDLWSAYPHHRRDLSPQRTLELLEGMGLDELDAIEPIRTALAEDLGGSDFREGFIPNFSKWLTDRKWDRKLASPADALAGVVSAAPDIELVAAVRRTLGEDVADMQLGECWHGRRDRFYVLGGDARRISWIRARYARVLAQIAEDVGYDGLVLVEADAPPQSQDQEAA